MNTVVSKDGTKIAYDRSGRGPALILAGGAFSYREFPGMKQLAACLAEKFTIFNYDRRGRGDSGDRMPYSADREIEDLEAMIEEAGGQACVYGLSSGAVLALQAAAQGAPISRLALHEPPFVVDPGDPLPPADFVRQVTELIAKDQRAEAIRYFMIRGMGAPAFVPFMLRMMPGPWARMKAVAHTLPYDAALLEGYMAGRPLNPESWRGVDMPTLVLEGTESPAALRHAARAVTDALPHARLVSRQGLGHTKKLDARRISQELEAFFSLDSREAPAAGGSRKASNAR